MKLNKKQWCEVKEKKLIFVCSPYSGDIEKNTVKAKEIARSIIDEGNVPFVPHLYFPVFLDESKEDERELGINLGSMFLVFCDELRVYGLITRGMKKEIDVAVKINCLLLKLGRDKIEITYIPKYFE